MKKIDKNFKYVIILLIILILGILIFGNYDLNLSLIEGLVDYTEISKQKQKANLFKADQISSLVIDSAKDNMNTSRSSAPGD
tara:strand:+ start:127 stop:372 length:246 start_codon:yes stop_codon:yes gene_type:complete